MPSIKYVGPHDEVSVDGLGVVKRHDSIDAPDELAKSLLEQTDNWSVPTKVAVVGEKGPELVRLKKSTNNDKQES